MSLKPGTRLKSQVDTTEVIVIRAPAGELDLGCGGHPMIDLTAEPAGGLSASGDAEPAQLGKRYSLPGQDDLEILVTKAGGSGLSVGGVPLEVKQAKPLPSSD